MNGSNKYSSDQENFWASEFGTEYISRNNSDEMLAANLNFFSNAMKVADKVDTCIEFGANVGMNLRALKLLFPKLSCDAVEINPVAAKELKTIIGKKNVTNGSILDFSSDAKWDLALIKGVLIHINPAHLPAVYDKLVAATKRYLMVAEYYSPTPVKVDYRGHSDRLFKRDFAGEILSRHKSMRLIDYGFNYSRDPKFPMDDINWFLLERWDLN